MRGKVRERILRVLLNNYSGDVSKYWIAKQAGCTYPWVREFFLKPADMGLVKEVEKSKTDPAKYYELL